METDLAATGIQEATDLCKILIFGNSGSGKSTLAKELCATGNLAHLDLDTLAWQFPSSSENTPPLRAPLADSAMEIHRFIGHNQNWVIEGCYSDLLELALTEATEIIFLNLPAKACIANARQRPWEPHKYKSRQAQDANLDMLIDWIAQYHQRTDTFSYAAHRAIYDRYAGCKKIYFSNNRKVRTSLGFTHSCVWPEQ